MRPVVLSVLILTLVTLTRTEPGESCEDHFRTVFGFVCHKDVQNSLRQFACHINRNLRYNGPYSLRPQSNSSCQDCMSYQEWTRKILQTREFEDVFLLLTRSVCQSSGRMSRKCESIFSLLLDMMNNVLKTYDAKELCEKLGSCTDGLMSKGRKSCRRLWI
uniref:Saposin B-type domain-containing protein n=1 Tax=Trichobilharzia regenti TaxID=157069 RepID=A0AA85K9D7_TRIRE|nr:unnamed protein product [Trichobilharzia regenti]